MKKHLVFKVSPVFDYYAYRELIKTDEGKKLLSKIKIDADINGFVLRRYREKGDDFAAAMKDAEIRWMQIESFFFSETIKYFTAAVKLFGISAIPSIWPVYGRFMEKKFITFPYERGTQHGVYVIAHELLHLYFYQYLDVVYGLEKDVIENENTWDVSEVLNVLIQESPSWVNNFTLVPKPYQRHTSLYAKMKNTWEKNPDMSYLVKRFVINVDNG